MAKNYCLNGTSVTEQVIKYQNTRESKHYLPIQLYYDDYKDRWYSQVEDYMDRITFESDFDFKLFRAVDTFREEIAKSIAKEKGYLEARSRLGAFNGWFYSILRNWKSNIKTSAFRLKKRPSIQCPICGRKVPRIDVQHLEHYKSTGDLPKIFTWKGNIYETNIVPKVYAVMWGERTSAKWRGLNRGNIQRWARHKRRVRWPWKVDDQKMVVCPLTRKIIPEINNEHIQSLPDKHSRYAEKFTWERFITLYPASLIQSEVYRLDHIDQADEETLRECISKNGRITINTEVDYLDWNMIKNGTESLYYENAFHIIDQCVDDESDGCILKLLTAGYSVEDISDTLSLDKRDVRQRIKELKENTEMEEMLLEK